MTFTLNDKQQAQLAPWARRQDAFVLEKQKQSKEPFIQNMLASNGYEYPYYGAIGGVLTYCFTPTSIGVELIVKHAGTGAEINLTDYSEG
jgi:hypothetical protein